MYTLVIYLKCQVYTPLISALQYSTAPLFLWECPEHSLQEKAGDNPKRGVCSGLCLSGYPGTVSIAKRKNLGFTGLPFPLGKRGGSGAWGECEEYGGLEERRASLGALGTALKGEGFRRQCTCSYWFI